MKSVFTVSAAGALAATCAMGVSAGRAGAGGCAPAWDVSIGTPGFADGYISCFATYDDGSGAGPRLYAAGSTTTTGLATVNRIAVWTGSAWQAVGSGIDDDWANAMITWNDGNGEALYVGGFFDSVSGVPGTTSIARWDGTQWTALQQGVNSSIPSVWSLAIYDDGGGDDLYVGGNFASASGVTANLIARWDGANWSDVGGGLSGVPGSAIVLAMAVYDDGNGPALYCAGRLQAAANGTIPVAHIAKWDGSTWSPVGGGITGTQVLSMALHDPGTGTRLYVAGGFTAAGGMPATRIAAWDGASWSALGTGLSSNVNALRSYDDGTGPALYAAGAFTTAGGMAVNRIARWDGMAWSAVGGGATGGTPFGLGVHDGDLYMGGSFTMVEGAACNRVAAWRGCPVNACPADLDGDGAVGSGDLAILLGSWGTANADLDDDGSTGSSDLAILLGSWGEC